MTKKSCPRTGSPTLARENAVIARYPTGMSTFATCAPEVSPVRAGAVGRAFGQGV